MTEPLTRAKGKGRKRREKSSARADAQREGHGRERSRRCTADRARTTVRARSGRPTRTRRAHSPPPRPPLKIKTSTHESLGCGPPPERVSPAPLPAPWGRVALPGAFSLSIIIPGSAGQRNFPRTVGKLPQNGVALPSRSPRNPTRRVALPGAGAAQPGFLAIFPRGPRTAYFCVAAQARSGLSSSFFVPDHTISVRLDVACFGVTRATSAPRFAPFGPPRLPFPDARTCRNAVAVRAHGPPRTARGG